MFEIILISLLTIVGTCIATISGFGVSTLMTPILLLFFSYREVILLVGILHWAHNIWKLGFSWSSIDWRLCIYFGIPGIITTIIGARMVMLNQAYLTAALGLFILAYAIIFFLLPKLHIKYSPTRAIIGGSLTGFCAGAFGIRGTIQSIFLSVFDPKKMTYVATIALIGFVIDSSRLIVYFVQGLRLEPMLMYGLLLFIPCTFLGVYLGLYLVKKVPQDIFRRVVMIFLGAAGMFLFVTSVLKIVS